MNAVDDGKSGVAGYHTVQTPSPSAGEQSCSDSEQVELDVDLPPAVKEDIALRYRNEQIHVNEAQTEVETLEIRVFRVLESVFCFLKRTTLYEARKVLKFVIIWQGALCTIRFLPILLGYSFRSTVPYLTLIFGWHGANHLASRSLLLYKLGMQLSIVVDVLWYVLGWNGSPSSTYTGEEAEDLSKETAYWIHLVLSVIVFLCNITGLLYGWKLRRIVKSVVNQRECERAAFVAEPKVSKLDVNEPVAKRSVTLGAADSSFASNTIHTSKYTFWNFFFVFFKMQFSRLANVYTSIVVGLCFFSFSPVGPEASLIPLLIVFTTAAIKDVSEDLRRHKSDFKVNSKPVRVLCRDEGDATLDRTWKDVAVGDLIVLKAGDEVPADCLMLATDNKNGMCYVQTANLDGETNMKIRQALTTNTFANPNALATLRVSVSCDAPNKNMFEWSGYVDLNEGHMSASIDNLLLRGCDLVSSEWTVALVLYTGPETKIALNASDGVKKNKRSLVERSLDSMFVIVMVVLFTISLYCSLGNRRWSTTNTTMSTSVYPAYLYGGNDGAKRGDYIFLSYVILFNNLIPLSMYVTMEGIRFVHARYIESDLAMYDAASDMPAEARNSNINEDLGQIKYIFSDKTGTLTRNEMVFAKCTIAGLKYNDMDLDKSARRGTRFNDPRLLHRLNNKHGSAHHIHEFLTLLMVCNTAMPQMETDVRYQASSPDEQALCLAAHDLSYCLTNRRGSKCEVTIQGVAAEFEILHVVEFTSDRKRMSVICRTPSGRVHIYCKGADDVIFDRLDPAQPQGVLHVTKGHLQDYASQGLRTLTTAMRVIPPEEYAAWKLMYDDAEASMDKAKLAAAAELVECGLTLLGATAIEDLLQEGVGECITSLRKAGINFWVLTGDKKETAISVGMSSEVIHDSMDVIVLDSNNKEQLTDTLEALYAQMVEDKWGTKKDDSISVVIFQTLKRVCVLCMNHVLSMLSGKYREQPKQLHRKRRRPSDVNNINMDVFPHHDAVSSVSSMDPFAKEFEPVGVQPPPTNESSTQDTADDDLIEYAMVIDGKTLALVLDDDIKYLFLAVAQQCKSVVCCRCSPSQKAAVVRLVTEPTLLWTPGNVSLAIGDGANDVPMIQAASVGVGISGKEGRQAVLSSDYSFAQFRFLKRLVLVHGNYSYKRVSKLLLFSFMKNIALSFTGFFMAPQTLYSGLLMYFSILFTLYNALFSTIPIVILAMYNQDVSPSALMQYPTLYHNGLDNRSFNMSSFLGWCGLGIWHAYVVSSVPFTCDGYYFNWFSEVEADTAVFHGAPLGLWADGVASYTYLIVASTFQISLLTSNWTMPNCVGVYGTLVFYFAFMWFFCSAYTLFGADFLEMYEASNVFQQLSVEAWFWLGMVMSGVVAVLPNFILRAGRVLFYPEPSHLMREWNKMPTDDTTYGDETSHQSPRIIRNQTGFAFSEGSAIERQTVLRSVSH
ncbi:hypothetical protein DYB37_001551 [Aphanomyces astaci]|uniref:Phospholipid-transporting ATPase n=2 Tax=Aphanomyces astaci TaxID=112090 RepID=A0A418EYY9_APHAT|nr:hypothetical protein DYB37_001551 [Aphanomyces astaci]